MESGLGPDLELEVKVGGGGGGLTDGNVNGIKTSVTSTAVPCSGGVITVISDERYSNARRVVLSATTNPIRKYCGDRFR